MKKTFLWSKSTILLTVWAIAACQPLATPTPKPSQSVTPSAPNQPATQPTPAASTAAPLPTAQPTAPAPAASPTPAPTPLPTAMPSAISTYTRVAFVAGTGEKGDVSTSGKGDQTSTAEILAIAFNSKGDALAVDNSLKRFLLISPEYVQPSFDRRDPINPYHNVLNFPLVDPYQKIGDLISDGKDGYYYSDEQGQQVFALNEKGERTLIAGDGQPGMSGDAGEAKSARLNRPRGLALDSKGNLYIADSGNHRIRRVTPEGKIYTFAGITEDTEDGIRGGFSGDGGPALDARMEFPFDIAIDSQGQLYVIDEMSQRVRKIDTQGVITTVAGTGVKGYNWQPGKLAKDVHLYNPRAIAVDRLDRLYIADFDNHYIRRVESDGTLNEVVGTGDTTPYRFDVTPNNATCTPTALAFNAENEMYFFDQTALRIMRVTNKAKPQ